MGHWNGRDGADNPVRVAAEMDRLKLWLEGDHDGAERLRQEAELADAYGRFYMGGCARCIVALELNHQTGRALVVLNSRPYWEGGADEVRIELANGSAYTGFICERGPYVGGVCTVLLTDVRPVEVKPEPVDPREVVCAAQGEAGQPSLLWCLYNNVAMFMFKSAWPRCATEQVRTRFFVLTCATGKRQ